MTPLRPLVILSEGTSRDRRGRPTFVITSNGTSNNPKPKIVSLFEMLPRQCRSRRDRAEILLRGRGDFSSQARSSSIRRRESFHIRARDERQLPKARSLVSLGGPLVAEDRTGLVGYLVVQLGATTIATVETRHEDIH